MGEIPFPGWDPVFLHLFGPIDLRYYGLMYVVAFVIGNMLLVRLARARMLPIPPEKVGDLIFSLILGVILGGRLGYCLFYKPELLLTIEVFKLWEGGLAFHGGFLGVVVALIIYGLRNGVPNWRLADCLALATCPGIFAVRCANFINGELYGRVISEDEADSVPWAMRFPSDPAAQRELMISGATARERELDLLRKLEDGTWDRVKDQVPLRHPSQVYEAIAEGLILGLVLLVVYRVTRKRPLGNGVYAGIFVAGYGFMRFFIEYYRQPDDHFTKDKQGLGTVLWGFSMGQVLCFIMIVVGSAMILGRWKYRVPIPGEDGTTDE
jgi:phosphatidylglycerol:prolipoprotein diacylglycerol transferase